MSHCWALSWHTFWSVSMCAVSCSGLAPAGLIYAPHPHRRCSPAVTTHQSCKVMPAPNLVDLLLQGQGPLLRLKLQRGVTLQEAAVPASAHCQQAAGPPNTTSTAQMCVLIRQAPPHSMSATCAGRWLCWPHLQPPNNLALQEDGPALVQPKVLPACVGH